MRGAEARKEKRTETMNAETKVIDEILPADAEVERVNLVPT